MCVCVCECVCMFPTKLMGDVRTWIACLLYTYTEPAIVGLL